ncbi:reverse transcriptase domain-containing protein [Tanacetum coccineum]
MQEGMLLGYKVNTDGLKVCPDKADAVLSLPSSGCLKDVQKVNGKLASLNRFLSKSAEKSLSSPNVDRTKGKGGANHILSRGQGSYQCSLNDRKGGQANASVLCEPRPTRVRDQLHPQDKLVLACLAQAGGEKILPGTTTVLFEATNNEAEYEALIAGLRIAEQMGAIGRTWKGLKTLTSNFKEFSIKQVPRSENKKADALSKIASTSFAHLSKQVLVEELNEKSINEKEVLAVVEEEDTH